MKTDKENQKIWGNEILPKSNDRVEENYTIKK